MSVTRKSSSVVTNHSTATAPIWQPTPGITWQIQLSGTLDTTPRADVYDIDMFDNDESVIQSLHSQGRKVICYFSAGTFEKGRPDASSFQDSDLGNTMADWPDEKWLNLKSDNVKKIMTARIKLAAAKGCDAIDPDNMDCYQNDNTGVACSQQDSIDFVSMMSDQAASLGLSTGLKNSLDIIPSVLGKVNFAVNEQCSTYGECSQVTPFVDAGKAVFHIEYDDDGGDGSNAIGDSTDSGDSDFANLKMTACSDNKLSTLIKHMDLGSWSEGC